MMWETYEIYCNDFISCNYFSEMAGEKLKPPDNYEWISLFPPLTTSV